MVKVSIIVPVYGVEKYIEKCARSIFEQTYSNLEIIFVNDCTPDKSVQVIQKVLSEYPSRTSQVSILSQSKNKGVAAARKRGLESITGDYCIQFDSDDFVEPSMIEEMVRVAVHDDADIVMCDLNLVSNNSTTHVHVNPNLDPVECIEQILTGEVHSSLCNKLVRVRLYRDYKIQFVEGLNMREDLGVMYRLLYFAHKLAYLPKPFYNYVLRGGSVSSSRMNIKQQENAQDLINEMNMFCVQKQINNIDLLDAFSFFKAQIKTDILLFGRTNALKKELYDSVRFKHVYSHPQMAFSHKLMGILDMFKLRPLVWVYRKIIDSLLVIKS